MELESNEMFTHYYFPFARRRKAIQKSVTLDHNKDFVCKITEESSQPCSYILFHALTNTKILNYKTDSFLMRTRSESLIFIKTNFPFSAHSGGKAYYILFQ